MAGPDVEIALSIVAELLAVHTGSPGTPWGNGLDTFKVAMMRLGETWRRHREKARSGCAWIGPSRALRPVNALLKASTVGFFP